LSLPFSSSIFLSLSTPRSSQWYQISKREIAMDKVTLEQKYSGTSFWGFSFSLLSVRSDSKREQWKKKSKRMGQKIPHDRRS
jgi:hypothetical protein